MGQINSIEDFKKDLKGGLERVRDLKHKALLGDLHGKAFSAAIEDGQVVYIAGTGFSEFVVFPSGVAGEMIEDAWFARDKSLAAVKKLFAGREFLYDEYIVRLVKCYTPSFSEAEGVWQFGKLGGGSWNFNAVRRITGEVRKWFNQHQLDLYLCVAHKVIRDGHHGGDGGGSQSHHYTRWITFIDTTKAPGYAPPYVWNGEEEMCTIM